MQTASRLIVSVVILLGPLLCHYLLSQIPDIGPVGDLIKAHTGFQFTEGPAADAHGNVYFTDVQRNRIHKIDSDGQLSTFLENSQGCNGLMFDARGRLIACQSGAGRIIAIDVANKGIEVVADQYQGRRFNSPNDLVLDRSGGVYFSDPFFGAGQMSQDLQAVYYITADRQVTRLIGNLVRPNGLILSPDEKNLYVLSGQPILMVYPIEGPGLLGEGHKLADLQGTGGGDGMTIDTLGNLYVTRPSSGALQVLTSQGQSLGMIAIPEAPSNCTFGALDMKTIFITARTSIYAARMESTGHRFAVPIAVSPRLRRRP